MKTGQGWVFYQACGCGVKFAFPGALGITEPCERHKGKKLDANELIAQANFEYCRRLPIPSNQRTFEEMIVHGIGFREGIGDKLNKHEIESGMPWHFKYRGVPFSHENNDMYVVTPRNGPNIHFCRGDRIVIDDESAVTLIKQRTFHPPEKAPISFHLGEA